MSRQKKLHARSSKFSGSVHPHPHRSVMLIGISINMQNMMHYEVSSHAIFYLISTPSQRDRCYLHYFFFYKEIEAQR